MHEPDDYDEDYSPGSLEVEEQMFNQQFKDSVEN
jgi:hypothetical protein